MTYSIDDSFSTLFSCIYIILFLYIIVYRNKVIKRTSNVLVGKKSKFTSSKHIIIAIFLSLVSGYMVYVYTQKKNKEIQENRYGLKYPLMTSFTVFIVYNMITREAGVTLI